MVKKIGTADRVLSVLRLFTTESPEWTVEAIGSELRLSSSTAYEYVGSLVNAGLLVVGRTGHYTVGPAAIELDRIARQVDPLTSRARSILRELVEASGAGTIGLLCRLYRLHVMCVDQYSSQPPEVETSYERGRPIPLTRGSASKAILANLPPRALRRFYEQEHDAIGAAGLGGDWQEFKDEIRRLRRCRPLISVGELDAGALGISAPVFDENEVILGSISLVLAAESVLNDPERIERLGALVQASGKAVTDALRAG
jgi:DNA-binding IclR family transcriptional regulator